MISLGPQAANWGQPPRPDNTGRRIEPGTCLDPGHAARFRFHKKKDDHGFGIFFRKQAAYPAFLLNRSS
jgi:hypothetical protein